MIAAPPHSERIIAASATAILHVLALIILLLARVPSVPLPQRSGVGLLLFDLPGAASSVSRSADQASGTQLSTQPPPPLLSKPSDKAAMQVEVNLEPGIDTDGATASGVGGAVGGADPFAMASLATTAPRGAAGGPLPEIATAILTTFLHEHPGLAGPVRIELRTDAEGRVVEARYAGGAIGNLRGALLAGYFRNCRLGLPEGVRPLDFDLASLPGHSTPNIATIDDQGCHI